jgi:hypothetical protein
MLKFDDLTVTLTPDKAFVLQLFVYGQSSGYPAETNYVTLRQAWQDIGDALAEFERRETDEHANVIDFKQHG